MVGCGNALLSEEMYDDGYYHITNIDISNVVIKQMKHRNSKKRPLMEYIQADVTKDLAKKFDQFFDVVIDKSTIDTLLCGENPYIMTAKMTKEI